MNKLFLLIVLLVPLLFIYFDENKYILKNKSFYVQQDENIKLVNNISTKLIYSTSHKTILGKKTIFPVDKEYVVFELIDGIYLYKDSNNKVKKVLNEGFSILEYNNAYKVLLLKKKNSLYFYSFITFKLEKIKEIEIADQFLDIYENPIFIDNQKILFKEKTGKLKVFNKTDGSTYDLKEKIFSKCYPQIYLKEMKYICKENNEFYLLNLENKKMSQIKFKPYSTYLNYISDLNAIMYTSQGISFKGEKFTTRIYFIDSKKDYLWSKEFIQPVRKSEITP